MIKRVDQNNVIKLDNGECFQIDDDTVQSWKEGDEILLPEERNELINQSRGNQSVGLPLGD